MLAVFLILERLLFFARWFIDYMIPDKLRIVEIQEKRRDLMVKGYYKLLLEDPEAEEERSEMTSHSQVEALVPVEESRNASMEGDVANEWKCVEIEQILEACRDAKEDTRESSIATFSARDPGFEPPWDEPDSGDEAIRGSGWMAFLGIQQRDASDS